MLILHSSTSSNGNANSRLVSWLLITSFNPDDCSSYVTSNPLFYILLTAFRRRALPFRVLTRADCPVSPTNATGGQIDRSRWPEAVTPDWSTASDPYSKPAVKQSGTSTKQQLSWLMLIYTRITHSRQCRIYNVIVIVIAGVSVV